MSQTARIGYGEDAHRLVPGRPLVVGGVTIPDSPVGSDAHSDGDVVLHALADALLSAWALGDIGQYFPPGDPETAGINSSEIVTSVLARVRRLAGAVMVQNLSGVVVLDQPKLGDHRRQIERRLASLVGLEPGRVGVTFKTSEGLAPGHIQARVTILLAADRS